MDTQYLESMKVKYHIPTNIFEQFYKDYQNDDDTKMIGWGKVCSINRIKQCYDYFQSLGVSPPFFDMIETYHGCGHWVIGSYYPVNGQFFFRMDGGGNGYEREYNEKFFFGIVIDRDNRTKKIEPPEFDPKRLTPNHFIDPSQLIDTLKNKSFDEIPIVLSP
jgi:hypothetical protein